MNAILTNHTSPETAYVVNNYPYGWTLRCKIRYWIEDGGRKGQRFCSQTTNPKLAGEVWNKPKKSIYAFVMVMFLNDQGHVKYEALATGSPAEIVNFRDRYASQLSEWSRKALEYLEKVSRRVNPVCWAEFEAKNAPALYTFEWNEGGFNSVMARTEAEALENVRQQFGSSALTVNKRTIRRLDSKEEQAAYFRNIPLMD